jgi:hypothetical protein
MSTETVKLVKSQNNEFGCGCNLDLEFTDVDEELIKKLNLTSEELTLKEKNLDEFWKMLAEKLRSKLSDTLEDNQEVNYYLNVVKSKLHLKFVSLLKKKTNT